MTLNLLRFAIILVTAHSLRAMITFNNMVSHGASCSYYNTSPTSIRLDCSGLGFVTADALSASSQTSVSVTVLSADTVVGVGLGERVDSRCSSMYYPESGTTWYNCQSCYKDWCNYNQITAFTSSSYASTLSPSLVYQIGKKYNWEINPPPTSTNCWQIDLSMDSPDGSFSSTTINPGYSCQKSYTFTGVYAMYFELETSGTASFLLEEATLHCLSYYSGDCVACDSGYYIASGVCKKCDSSCATCSGPGSKQCTTCSVTGKIPVSGFCQYCSSSQFANYSSMTCQSCSSSCKTCSGSASNCTSCVSTQMLYYSQCITCASFTYPDQTKKQCLPCHSTCASCSGANANNCKSCIASGKVAIGGYCRSCAFHQYADYDTQTCQTCDSSCGMCSGGGLDQCTTCYLADESPSFLGTCPRSQLVLAEQHRPKPAGKTVIIVVVLLIVLGLMAVVGVVWYRRNKRKRQMVDPNVGEIERPISPPADVQERMELFSQGSRE